MLERMQLARRVTLPRLAANRLGGGSRMVLISISRITKSGSLRAQLWSGNRPTKIPETIRMMGSSQSLSPLVPRGQRKARPKKWQMAASRGMERKLKGPMALGNVPTSGSTHRGLKKDCPSPLPHRSPASARGPPPTRRRTGRVSGAPSPPSVVPPRPRVLKAGNQTIEKSSLVAANRSWKRTYGPTVHQRMHLSTTWKISSQISMSISQF